MDADKTMAQPDETCAYCVEGAEIKSGEAQDTFDAMEVEATEEQIDAEPKPEDNLSEMEAEAAETKPVKAETKESKAPEPKVKNSKSLPFNPAKVKAAAAKTKGDRTTGADTAGKKPTGVRKSRGTKPPKRNEKGGTPSLNDMLGEARKWLVAPTSYMIKNPDTGCFGLSVRKPDAERSEITIAHGQECRCLDVRLMHIARHVDGVVKARHLARRFRDSFVIATKIRRRLPHPVPKAARFPARSGEKQVIRRPRAEVDAEVAIINVVDVHRQQRLIEKWKSLQAYKERPIWKDW
ncbi:hypothetical protein F5B21DRAFT_123250 [Xylaria acuta]|nr:hypothetical protein F5B21DRAFT_123250 [Xylaria acuta]